MGVFLKRVPVMALACAASIISAARVSAQPRTTLDGIYTEEQASRGAEAFESKCASCHEGEAPDGPSLEGRGFVDRWREDSLTTLFAFIRKEMPRNEPGSLPEAMSRDILAYLLELNRYPAGPAELTVDVIARTQLVGLDGPKPVPSNAAILAVGCLTAAAGGAWTLTEAGEPSRTRNPEEISREEISQKAAGAPGKRSYRLTGLEDLEPGKHTSHRVAIKGTLLRESNADRIHVKALADTETSCVR